MEPRLFAAAVLLGACVGCGAMEDFVYGPDPAIPDMTCPVVPPPNLCAAPPPITTTSASQTQEPPLLPAGR